MLALEIGATLLVTLMLGFALGIGFLLLAADDGKPKPRRYVVLSPKP